MKIHKRIAVAILVFAGGVAALEIGEQAGVPVAVSLISEAQAVVGRPLTPVSVAGVARRTSRRAVRRCASGMTC